MDWAFSRKEFDKHRLRCYDAADKVTSERVIFFAFED